MIYLNYLSRDFKLLLDLCLLIDASTKWSHVCLLFTRNVAFATLLAQKIRLREQFPNYQIRKFYLDNVGEFTSQAFDDYCIPIEIDVKYPVTHTHTQNDLSKLLIKRLQIIARPLLMKSKLHVSAWSHVILHTVSLVHFRPNVYHKYYHCKLYLANNQIFFTCVGLVVLYMYLLHRHNALRWVLNVDLEFI